MDSSSSPKRRPKRLICEMSRRLAAGRPADVARELDHDERHINENERRPIKIAGHVVRAQMAICVPWAAFWSQPARPGQARARRFG